MINGRKIFIGLCLFILPQWAAAQHNCKQLVPELSYCNDAFEFSEGWIGTQFPNLVAMYEVNARPFTTTAISVIDARQYALDPQVIYQLAIGQIIETEADVDLIENPRLRGANFGSYAGMQAEFTGRSRLGFLTTSFVVDGYDVNGRVVLLFTMDEEDSVTDRLRAMHQESMRQLLLIR